MTKKICLLQKYSKNKKAAIYALTTYLYSQVAEMVNANIQTFIRIIDAW